MVKIQSVTAIPGRCYSYELKGPQPKPVTSEITACPEATYHYELRTP
ncbi:hypothetical protein [Streptosporangium pseudovulgare]|uniref:Uncharacterized protein n=1 Tax=Streptosporangium pseudovulgare TaxID=35765 RepID=A0ABQ2RJ10_9ACTN|nr:hypothetical protein [Streptosporangium pseudovulgare]GGQ34849.1 hypothetical protein GCM10010140_76170 [Streptosporangium pseudovulgare]